MSLGARATKGGVKKDGKQDKGKVAEKPAPKEKTKPQATTEQLRMANMIDCKSEDASDVRRMVTELMDMTRRTEEEVCSALHDSDNDLQAACNLLLEESQRIQGEWQTSEKKKKKPPAPSGNGDADRDARDRDARSRSGPRRRGEGESVPGAGGGRGRGAGRGRGGSRGGRGAGRGARRAGPPRPHAHTRDADWPHAPDTGGNIDSFPTTEDWDNEEWSGSLSDTKVFTPSSSALPTEPPQPTEDWESGETNGGEHIPTYTYHNTHQHIPQMSNTNAASSVSAGAAAGEDYGGGHHQPMGMSGSLSAAQTQYLSQFTTQTRHDGVYGYGVYGGEATRKQRARVPPPSKIPSSAVEMPGGSDGTSNVFLDVQFGALEPDALHDLPQPSHASHSSQSHASHAGQTSQSQAPASQSPTIPVQTNKQVTSQVENQSVPSHETTTEAPSNSYSNANSMLSESLSAVDATPTSQPVTSESVVTNSTSLDKLSASMKQLGVSGGVAGGPAGVAGGQAGGDPPRHHYSHHGPKVTSPTAGYQSIGQQNVYAPHHVSHHPPVYGANVYAPQVNSTNASLTGASMASGYPSSVTLTQYQPIINSYQQQQQTPSTTVSAVSVSAYGGSALYTAAPYTAPPAHHPYHHAPKHHKDSAQAPQYDSSVASSNSLTSTSTTQTSTAKVATTTGGGAAGAVSSSSSAAGAGAGAGAGAAYAGGALYGGAYAYDEQLMRGTLPHHMGPYYEVGYGTREGTFGLGAGERFGRTDAASPQQVPAALPPGYAYFYQPPPTSYQYGVYPPYGGGSSVGGVGVTGGGKVSAYTQQQQPPYDAQDTYKPGGPYTGSASKAGGGANDLTNTMYAKTHVALNKVNSYEKAAFHSGTPPPFGAGSHLYIPAPPHHHPHHHAPQQHQESGSGARSSTKPAASKPAYSQSYWTPN